MIDEAGKYKPDRISRKPADILALPYIPQSILCYLPGTLGPPTRSDKRTIKHMLNMRVSQPFKRCKGKLKSFVKKAEARGDFSHSDKNHLCDECRCGMKAGCGTKGDFYGLGAQTGMLGVGFCSRCIQSNNYSPGLLVKHARREMEDIRKYGAHIMSADSEYALKIVKEEAEMAKTDEKVRTELVLITDHLEEFRELCKSGAFTESTKEGPQPASDKTRVELALKIALAISKLNLDHFKMSENDYIHKAEIQTRMPEMIVLVNQCLAKLEEMLITKHVKGEEVETDRPIQEYVREMFMTGMADIWNPGKIKHGRQK